MKNIDFIKYASVILDVNLDKMLEYGITEDQADDAKVGTKVEVLLKGKPRNGYILALNDQPSFNRVLPIQKIMPQIDRIPKDLCELAFWMAKYYCCSFYKVLKVILPSSIRKNVQVKQQLFVMRGKTREELKKYCEEIRNKHSAQAAVLDEMLKVKKGILLTELLEQTKGTRSPIDTLAKKGFLIVDIVRVDRSPLIKEEYFQTRPKTLNEDQALSLAKIKKSIELSTFETHLLHGVTGSGKTEVYLQAISKALEMNKGTIMLVPEISLTAQTIERFRSRFEGKIAILHHRLSQGERLDEWHRICRGEATIVIGARSAVFSPLVNLGLIIVDEEHEHSYKQNEEVPCYHARDIAVMRGKMTNSAVILGSATPSLESYHNAQIQKYNLSILNNRADSASIPKVTIIDMKKEFEKFKGLTSFSDPLLNAIKKRHEAGEQTILFLNRRGYHTTLFCRPCAEPIRCNHCDVALTFHLGDNSLSCHLCGYRISPPPTLCLKCNSPNPMKYRGVGTEHIEKALHAVFPEIRTTRVDADTTRHKGSHQKLLREFGSGKSDVLIGTQMIAKGLHFPSVTLVGVLNSDATLNIPDFRASETVFQLIMQVSGRAGRGVIPGEVIVQTCMPENTTIKLASDQDYKKFYEEEIEIRRLFNYPPFTNLVKVAFSGPDQLKTLKAAEFVRQRLIQHLPSTFELNPVIPAGHAKIKDNFRYQFLIKGPSIPVINKAFSQLPEIPGSIRMLIDIHPISTYF